MAGDLLMFVSKRVSAVAAALLCLMATHLAPRPADGPVAASASEVRVAIRR